jgi:hypothetical protein
MFKLYKNLLLMALLTFGLSGCVERRVITIDTNSVRVVPHRTTTYRQSRRDEPIKEEILIRNNPNLVYRAVVPVPQNHPKLDIKKRQIEDGTELNGEIMERMPFPLEEYRGLRRNGNSTVSGIVYLENSINDERIIKKNLKLYLNPITSYSRQWYEQSYLGRYKMSRPDKRLFNYLKFTTTNDRGEFNFYGVPVGEYYIGVKLKCGSECGYSTSKILRIVKEIFVGYGTTRVELNRVVP